MPVRWRAFVRNIHLKPEAIIQAVAQAQYDHAEKQMEIIREYPAEKVPTRYTRTNNLFDSWDIEGPKISSAGIVTKISAEMFYSTWVHGDEFGNFQQPQHAGTGWKLTANYADKEGYRKAIQEAIDDNLH